MLSGEQARLNTVASGTTPAVGREPLALSFQPGTLDNPALARCWNTPTLPPSRHTHTEDEPGLPPRPPLRQAASVVTATNNKHKLRPPSPSCAQTHLHNPAQAHHTCNHLSTSPPPASNLLTPPTPPPAPPATLVHPLTCLPACLLTDYLSLSVICNL
ncbi:optomotor-blind protein-like [Eriocheir sinensis]|uniref:optomotor-blind protein-like n=1 Tax=Eriocheir sinensis TaxID=95602 RepID=UPI0021C928BB|nr:optomotor-blind protein-like [Eriocheir sinensis]